MKDVRNNNLIRFIRLACKNQINNLSVVFLIIVITLLSLMQPQVTKGIIDNGIMSKNIKLLFQLAIIYLIINILSSVYGGPHCQDTNFLNLSNGASSRFNPI